MWSWDKLLRFNIYWHKIKHVKTNDMIIIYCICIDFCAYLIYTIQRNIFIKNKINHARINRKV